METLNTLSARSLQYYVIAEHWASTLDFFKIETAFFEKLVEDYVIPIAEISGMEQLRQLLNNIYRLKEDESAISHMLAMQLKQLALMAEDIIPDNVLSVQSKQIEIEYLVADLTREFKAIKKDLFINIGHVITQTKHMAHKE